uniref:IgGFc-binding protein N-terminal domain-containing protein n=1 Tax=Setaria digitata TaxID=48799 RepID=A0A915PHC7_9BILA
MGIYEVPRQRNTILLDGKKFDTEYVRYFENPFRYIVISKMKTENLKPGIHCLESEGRYLLFIYGGSKMIYGYVAAFNAYPAEKFKWITENDPSSYRPSLFDVSFVTVFPWMTINHNTKYSATHLTLDIINPHPYMVAFVKINYYNETGGNLVEETYNIAPYIHHKIKISGKMMTSLQATYSDTIYKSNHDTRITITSTIPVSVTQNCFFDNNIGDSFAVLPLTMAGRKYSFSLPKSMANDSHAVIYFLPTTNTTKISIVARTDAQERFHEIEAKAEPNSSIFAYYGSDKKLSINLWGDNPFQVIIAMQKLLINSTASDINSRVDFGCTMAVPVMDNVCSLRKPESLYDLHYLLISQHQNYSGFFTMEPSDRSCPEYSAEIFPQEPFSKKQQLMFQPANKHHYFQLPGITFGYISTILCRYDLIQIYTFGGSNMEGSYIDFIPSVAQYVTGRSYFVARHYQNWILIFMDRYAKDDIEMDGIFIAQQYINEMPSPYGSGYFALQEVYSTTRIHYVQSTGRYIVHVLSDTLENGFYQYFVTLNGQMNVMEETESEASTEVTTEESSLPMDVQEPSTEKVVYKSSVKPRTIQIINDDAVDHHLQPVADGM